MEKTPFKPIFIDLVSAVLRRFLKYGQKDPGLKHPSGLARMPRRIEPGCPPMLALLCHKNHMTAIVIPAPFRSLSTRSVRSRQIPFHSRHGASETQARMARINQRNTHDAEPGEQAAEDRFTFMFFFCTIMTVFSLFRQGPRPGSISRRPSEGVPAKPRMAWGAAF